MYNHHPWRDVYSVLAWKKLLTITKSDGDESLTPIQKALVQYQELPKSEFKQFEARRYALRVLAARAADYLKEPGVNTNKHGAHKFTPASTGKEHTKAKSGKFIEDIGPWIASLKRRCGKKDEYLGTMIEFYGRVGISDSAEASPSRYMSYLNEMQKARSTDEHLRLTPQNRMERIDPYHRSAEFSLVDDEDDSLQIRPSDLPMSVALCQWLTSDQELPFFIWLESHPICTATPGLNDDYRGDFKDRVRMTKYETPSQEVIVSGAKLWIRDIGSSGTGKPLDTKDGGGKGFPMSYAFVWTKSGAIYSARHGLRSGEKQTPVHHSTFTCGKKVQCAGMWQVFEGKINLIDNNTGHYRTDVPRFYAFVDQLNKEGVFKAGAKVEDVLNQAARGGARKVSEWLEAAVKFDREDHNKTIKPPRAERVKFEEEVEKKSPFGTSSKKERGSVIVGMNKVRIPKLF